MSSTFTGPHTDLSAHSIGIVGRSGGFSHFFYQTKHTRFHSKERYSVILSGKFSSLRLESFSISISISLFLSVFSRIDRSRLFDEIDFRAAIVRSFRTSALFRNRGGNVPERHVLPSSSSSSSSSSFYSSLALSPRYKSLTFAAAAAFFADGPTTSFVFTSV